MDAIGKFVGHVCFLEKSARGQAHSKSWRSDCAPLVSEVVGALKAAVLQIALRNLRQLLGCTCPLALFVRTCGITLTWVLVFAASPAFSQTASASAPAPAHTESLASALSPQAWTQVEQSIDRALAWLASQQDSDGSIDAPSSAQPAATSL